MKNFIGSRALPELNYHRPGDIDGLLGLMGSLQTPFKVVAGCTDFIPAIRHGSWAFDDARSHRSILGDVHKGRTQPTLPATRKRTVRRRRIWLCPSG